MPAKKPKTLRWTIQQAATEFDASDLSIKRWLYAAGERADPSDGMFSTQQIVKAIFGDLEKEKLRKLRGEADLAELAAAQKRGELVEVAIVRRLGQQVCAAIRQKILQSPLSKSVQNQVLTDLLTLSDNKWTDSPDD